MNPEPHAGAEHLLIFPERAVADRVADELREEGFASVRVTREALRVVAGHAEDAPTDWGVHVVDHRLPVLEGSGAYEGLRERFVALVEEHDGWYDNPGDQRPPHDGAADDDAEATEEDSDEATSEDD